MVLLTQSQVGVALSSLVSTSSTSSYASLCLSPFLNLPQLTLALKVFLCTSALFLSGYVVQQKTLRDIQRAIKPQNVPLNAGLDVPLPFRSNSEDSNTRNEQPIEIEIKPSKGVDESMVGATRWQKAKKKRDAEERIRRRGEEGKREKRAAGKKEKTRGWWGGKKVEDEDQKPMSDAARRKKIKDHLIAAGEGETPQGYRRKWY
jgi:hypothetical protein